MDTFQIKCNRSMTKRGKASTSRYLDHFKDPFELTTRKIKLPTVDRKRSSFFRNTVTLHSLQKNISAVKHLRYLEHSPKDVPVEVMTSKNVIIRKFQERCPSCIHSNTVRLHKEWNNLKSSESVDRNYHFGE
jgi:hypothetical protein